MTRQNEATGYDPAKAHAYYERTKKLKGRKAASASSSSRRTSGKKKAGPPSKQQKAKGRIDRIRGKIRKLKSALSEVEAQLSEKRAAARKTTKANSDGKTTAKERQSSQDYRDKNQQKLATKAKQDTKSNSGGSKASSKSVSDMSVEDLEARATKIRATIKEARRQLSNANQQLGQLAHSAVVSNAHVNELFRSLPISRKDSVKMTGVADFSGYATRNDVRCSDGRTILAGAFEHQDGQEVPLMWGHGHDDPKNLLGHVILKNVSDGVKCDAYFNDSEAAQHMKKAVDNGDVKFLSIFANQLKENLQNGFKSVRHGMIREVSLVLAGANPEAKIDNLVFAHSDGEVEMMVEEAIITTGIEIVPAGALAHADSSTDTVTADDSDEDLQTILDTLDPKQVVAVDYLISQILAGAGDEVQHSDSDAAADDAGNEGDSDTETADSDAADADADVVVDESGDSETTDAEGDVTADADATSDADGDTDTTGSDSDDGVSSDADSVTDTADSEAGDEAVQHDNTNQEDNSMTHNVFDQSGKDGSADTGYERKYLAHDDIKKITDATMKSGSLKDTLTDFALEHGITNIDYLFPDPKLLSTEPSWIARRVEWVDKVLNTVKKTPFARIKTIHADITADEARARGYIKGNLKAEEFFELIKRETTPQTIYKKQKLDRDDVIDITDLDVIAYVKAEMKLLLDEEIAGAILIGDGRSNGDPDKINETKVRSILNDAELYTTTFNVNLDDASSSLDELIDAVIDARQYYKGTGRPTFYTTLGIAAKFRNLKDGFNHRMYKSLAEVAEVLDVAEVVPVELFSRVPDVVGILVNLTDYSIGTDRGGQATMFDDFDLDYNKLRYLLETRLSGALTVPHSAQAFRKVAGSNVTLADPTAPTYNTATNVTTIPVMSNVVYKNKDTNATLSSGAQAALTLGQKLNVIAVAATGYNFKDNAHDEWTFKYVAP